MGAEGGAIAGVVITFVVVTGIVCWCKRRCAIQKEKEIAIAAASAAAASASNMLHHQSMISTNVHVNGGGGGNQDALAKAFQTQQKALQDSFKHDRDRQNIKEDMKEVQERTRRQMKEKYEREMEIMRLKSQLEGKIAVTNASDAAIAAKDSF